MKEQAIFIDPSYEDFLEDRLFDLSDKRLNRDNQLLPLKRLQEHFVNKGIPVHTADKLRDGSKRCKINHYWSLGLLGGYKSFINDPSVRLRGFILMEPPLIQPKLYSALPELTTLFDEVYVHNTEGQGFSLHGVSENRLHKFYWPQPYDDVLSEYWNQDKRLNKLVVIAGNHNPRFKAPELYSARIKAVASLSSRCGIDLFGRGWERWWSHHSCWWPYWRYRKELMLNYKGSCDSKWEVLSRYRFSLCLENMPMAGYITEKIFDCLYAGTVPVYLGATNIEELIPSDVYVDMRKFNTYEEMFEYVTSMSDANWQVMRDAAKEFLRNNGRIFYHDSLLKIFHI